MSNLKSKTAAFFRSISHILKNAFSADPEQEEKLIDSQVIRFSLMFIAFFFTVFIIWGVTADIESAAVAKGVIKVESHAKTVQHLEGGIIKDILVKEGDFVTIGQPLILLDETHAGTQKSQINQNRFALSLKKQRLKAQMADADDFAISAKLQKMAIDDPALQILIDNETNIFKSRKESFENEKMILKEKIIQSENEVKGVDSQTAALQKQIVIYNEERQKLKSLFDDGYATKSDLNQIDREIARLEGDIGKNLSVLSRAKVDTQEVRMELATIKNHHLNLLAEEMQDVELKKADLDEQFIAYKDIYDRHIIAANQSGIISSLKHHTIGGIISPREPIMDIIPQNDALIIETRIDPRDIDIIYPGLPARIRFTAFNARTTPISTGIVDFISPDRIFEKDGESYYIANIVIKDASDISMHNVKLYPGMPVDVLIVTGERTFFGYLFSPISSVFQGALRES